MRHHLTPFLVRALSARLTAPRWMVLAPSRRRRPLPLHLRHSPNLRPLLPLLRPVPLQRRHGPYGHRYSDPAHPARGGQADEDHGAHGHPGTAGRQGGRFRVRPGSADR